MLTGQQFTLILRAEQDSDHLVKLRERFLPGGASYESDNASGTRFGPQPKPLSDLIFATYATPAAPPPTLSINVTVVEGSSGQKDAAFTVTRSGDLTTFLST
ncbi:MAG: hypothetical protein M3M97_02135 [Actinomycetota bacterium]|nr:hypothetical protein [Actinomycetota bacterium]